MLHTIQFNMIRQNILRLIDTLFKEKLDSGIICTLYISTHEQHIDILTKELGGPIFQRLIFKLGLEDI